MIAFSADSLSPKSKVKLGWVFIILLSLVILAWVVDSAIFLVKELRKVSFKVKIVDKQVLMRPKDLSKETRALGGYFLS